MKLLAVLIITLPFLRAFQEVEILPSLDNATGVGVTYIHMIDQNRLDPFTNYTRQREIMVSMYYPTRATPPILYEQRHEAGEGRYTTTPYMPPLTAGLYDKVMAQLGFPNNTFEQLSSLCQPNALLREKDSVYELLVFSPGAWASRFLYTTLLEDLARRGYVVVAIDHPFDALVVELPDGRAVIGLNKTLTSDEVELFVEVRAQDISFVIDEINGLYSALINTSHVVAFGHSLGGAAVAEAALSDERIKAGINIDGRLFGSMEKKDVSLSKPFLQFASEESSSDPYWRWDEAWERLAGWKLELVFGSAAHTSFLDLLLIAEVLGVREKLGEEVKRMLGKVDGMRGLEVVVEYVSAFAEFVQRGKNDGVLGSHGDERFPDVVVKRYI